MQDLNRRQELEQGQRWRTWSQATLKDSPLTVSNVSYSLNNGGSWASYGGGSLSTDRCPDHGIRFRRPAPG